MSEMFYPAGTSAGMNAFVTAAKNIDGGLADLNLILNGLEGSGTKSELTTKLREVMHSWNRDATEHTAQRAGLGRGGMQGDEQMHALDASYRNQLDGYIT